MKHQMIFERYEMKYMLTKNQKAAVLKAMEDYMALDKYGRVTIRNIYFDTDTYRLIRRSIERPAYKEKLRVRSYRSAGDDDEVFVELKKKYKSIVYKRRIALPQKLVLDCLEGGRPLPAQSQIAEEINYFCDYYKNLLPSVFLSYEREAFYALDGSDFRVTFDENILTRRQDFNFAREIYGRKLIDDDTTLMELKTSGGLPLWMVHCLSENKIYKSSFSKYGKAYIETIQNKWQGGLLHA